MFCDGSCMRAVHCGVQHIAPDADGSNSDDSDVSEQELQLVPSECNPLRMPLDLYQHLKDTKDVFHCPNCLTGVHQCFKCKKEGVEAAHQADPKNRIFAERLVVRCQATNSLICHFVSATMQDMSIGAARHMDACSM